VLASRRQVGHNQLKVPDVGIKDLFEMATPDLPADDVFLPGGRLRLDLLTQPAAQAIQESMRLARETRWDSVRSPHIFMGLLAVPDPGVANWGERLGADLPKLLGQFQELFHQEEGDVQAVLCLNREFLSDNVIRLLRDSYNRATDHDRTSITPMDLLITLLTASNSIVAECFERIGVTAAKLTELAVIAEQQTDKA
jgi:ATP-dependent Clp protease ATP-binding subunit ClpA